MRMKKKPLPAAARGSSHLRVLCDGDELTRYHWHADHRLAHVLGGKTTVSDGEAAYLECNWFKGVAPLQMAAGG